MSEPGQLVARFCGQCSCGCPELRVDDNAEPGRQVILADDFGQRVEMSREQAADLIRWAKSAAAADLLGSP